LSLSRFSLFFLTTEGITVEFCSCVPSSFFKLSWSVPSFLAPSPPP